MYFPSWLGAVVDECLERQCRGKRDERAKALLRRKKN